MNLFRFTSRNNHLPVLWVAAFLLFIGNFTLAQENPVFDESFKKATVERLSELIVNHYVFPDVAEQTSEELSKALQAGSFDTTRDLESFAEKLTSIVQEVNKDKHMRIRKRPEFKETENTIERAIEEKVDYIMRSKTSNAGFRAVKVLEGNVGYVDIRSFAPPSIGKPIADQYMALIKNCDAVIIDLRKNGGGSPEMVQYLCSYFFDQGVHLNSLYWRHGDLTTDFYSLEEVGGKKMIDVPLFVLTSNYTFSGAEEFSYNMQTQERATIVGETTGGGANPGGSMPINSELEVFIPTGRAINPITKTNWEGVGVVPEIRTDDEEALDKALELAKTAAKKYREGYQMKIDEAFQPLTEVLKKYTNKEYNSLKSALVHLVEQELMDEVEINLLGYDFLMGRHEVPTAQDIFKVNTELYPTSANVYDSYGESLMATNMHEKAAAAFEKAIDLADKNGDQNIEYFRENLQKAKRGMK